MRICLRLASVEQRGVRRCRRIDRADAMTVGRQGCIIGGGGGSDEGRGGAVRFERSAQRVSGRNDFGHRSGLDPLKLIRGHLGPGLGFSDLSIPQTGVVEWHGDPHQQASAGALLADADGRPETSKFPEPEATLPPA
jgi:hypothetical protein